MKDLILLNCADHSKWSADSLHPSQNPNHIFTKREKTIKFIWNYKGPQHILISDITHPNIKSYDKDTVIKIVWYCHKDRHIDQLNWIKSLEINPCMYTPLTICKCAKNRHWGKESLFNKWCWENWTANAKEFDWTLILHHKQSSTQSGLET